MEKTFKMENDIGIEINYTILGITNEEDKYAVFTNYLPSDNEIGIRLFAGKVVSEEPLKIEKISKKKEKEIVDEFKTELIKLGSKKVKAKKGQ